MTVHSDFDHLRDRMARRDLELEQLAEQIEAASTRLEHIAQRRDR